MNITNKVSDITGAHYGDSQASDVSLRIITDHIRSATFMICDGVLPPTRAGAMCCAACSAGRPATGSSWGSMSPSCTRSSTPSSTRTKGQYKDLREKQGYITKVIRTEEENFAKTIDSGLKIFSEMLAQHKAKGRPSLPGRMPSSSTTPTASRWTSP